MPIEPTSVEIARLRRLAWLVDAMFTLPGTRFRFGVNSLIGLVPVGGDAVLGVISLYFVYRAARLGVPGRTLAAMLGNIALEVGIGAIPVLGDVFDVVLKANLRNVALLERHFRLP